MFSTSKAGIALTPEFNKPDEKMKDWNDHKSENCTFAQQAKKKTLLTQVNVKHYA